MDSWTTLWGLVLFSISMAASPGPSNVLATASTANFGFRRSLPVLLGLGLGMGVMILGIGLGLSRLFEAFPQIHELLKYVGAAYLLYLAWKIAGAALPGFGGAQGSPMSFLQGGAFNWVNPKAWIAVVSVVSTYTVADRDLVPQVVLIACVFAVIATASVALWGLFGLALSRLLRAPKALRAFNIAMALLLVLSLVPLFV